MSKGEVPHHVLPAWGNPKQEDRTVQHLQTQIEKLVRKH